MGPELMSGGSGTLEGILDELRERNPVRYAFVVETGQGQVLATSGQRGATGVRSLGDGRPPGHPLPRSRERSGRTRFLDLDGDHILGVVADAEVADERLDPTIDALRRALAAGVP